MLSRNYDHLEDFLRPNKVLIIFGPRRVGKTTLLANFLSHTKLRSKLDSGDNIRTQQILGSSDFQTIMEYASGYEVIAIDEAQKISGIGTGLKILVDQVPGIKVIATGSSSFDIMQQTGEPLTGRKRTIRLFPLAQMELSRAYNRFELKEDLEEYLVFGSYPEVLNATSRKEKIGVLYELANSYLLKDILSFELLKGSQVLLNLLKLLAFQVSFQVSHHELAKKLGINVRTVSRYLDLLEKSFVVYRLGAFSRNLRNEVATKSKYYFYDNGIRNAIIDQFNPIAGRNDQGQLWENFVIIERLKKREYGEIYGSDYFWRSYSGKEIDLLEERDGSIHAFECKWSERKVTPPKEFMETYTNTDFSVITKENYLEVIL